MYRATSGLESPRFVGIRTFMRLPYVASVEDCDAFVGDAPVYLSLDIDVLDPAYAPATGTPEVGGYTTIQLQEILRGLGSLNYIGFDLVEVIPSYDGPGQITALLAANRYWELLALIALGKRPA